MNKLKQSGWILLLALWGCQPTPTVPTPASPSPSARPSATASPAPSPTASSLPVASPSPNASPSASPSATPSPEPTPTASATAAPSPSPTPAASEAPLDFSRIRVIAGNDPDEDETQLKSGEDAELIVFPSLVPGLAVDEDSNIWFLNGSARSLGYITPEITTGSIKDGNVDYRLYWERVAKLDNRGGMVYDPPSGEFYVVQSSLHRVVRVNPESGAITPVAGTGQQGFDGDGKATEVRLDQPSDISRDGQGNFYITDTGNHLIRKLTPDGRLITIAGQYVLDTERNEDNEDDEDDNPSYLPIGETTGDGGPAREARVDTPRYIAASADGDVYFTSDSLTIRRIARDRIDRVAGTGSQGYIDSGVRADLHNLNNTGDMVFGPDGLLYFADNLRIRRLRMAGNDWIIEDIAGNGRERDLNFSLTNLLNAELQPGPMDFDADGNLYVYDAAHRRLRMLERNNGSETGTDATNEN